MPPGIGEEGIFLSRRRQSALIGRVPIVYGFGALVRRISSPTGASITLRTLQRLFFVRPVDDMFPRFSTRPGPRARFFWRSASRAHALFW